MKKGKISENHKLKNYFELGDSLREAGKAVIENASLFTEMLSEYDNSELKTITANLTEMMDGLNKSLLESDFQNLKKAYFENMFVMIATGIDNLWFIDEEILLLLLDLYDSNEEFIFEEKILINYIEGNLDSYIEPILNSDVFISQRGILNEAIRLYKCGNFSLAIFPLIVAFDNLFTRWIKGSITEFEKDGKVYIPKLAKKLKSVQNKYNPTFTLNLNDTTKYTIVRAYILLFSNRPTEKTKRLNRNSIMHGSHDYNSVSKEDCMKLFVLLRLSLDAIRYKPIRIERH